jgi:hypothetical protein
MMVDFNMESIRLLMGWFGIEIPYVFASDIGVEGRSNEMIAGLLAKVGATCYLSGTGAKAYFEPTPYEKAGVEIVWQAYTPPVYPQIQGGFMPNMSSIDMFFNCGIEQSRILLREI